MNLKTFNRLIGLKLTYHKIHPLKVFCLMNFSHMQNFASIIIIQSQRTYFTLRISFMFVFSGSCSHPQFQATTSIVSIAVAVLFLEILYKRCGRQNKTNLMKFKTFIPGTCKYITSQRNGLYWVSSLLLALKTEEGGHEPGNAGGHQRGEVKTTNSLLESPERNTKNNIQYENSDLF